jgi:hypothetical protein
MLRVWVTFLGPAGAWPTGGCADWFWPTAEKAGLLNPGRASEFTRITERHPQLTLIVDHMGMSMDVVKAGKLTHAPQEAPCRVARRASKQPGKSMQPPLKRSTLTLPVRKRREASATAAKVNPPVHHGPLPNGHTSVS